MSGELPILDASTIQSLRYMDTPGEPSVLAGVLDEFTRDTERLWEDIRLSSESHDLGTLHLSAHSLKGSSGSIGAARLSDMAEAIEYESVRAERVGDELAARVEALGMALELTLDAVRALTRELRTEVTQPIGDP
jgi:HPt (histidine-containing phosphotransfer) domain-containing protein